MKGSEHADAVLDRVLSHRPWIKDEVRHAGRGRYARVYEYQKNVSLQVLFTTTRGAESLEVGIVFDDPNRSTNAHNLETYRDQLDAREAALGLKLRDGDTGVYYYLTRMFRLLPDTNLAYDEAAKLCLNLLDVELGGPAVRNYYRFKREQHQKRQGGA